MSKTEAQPTYSSMDIESIGPSFAEQYLESNAPATSSIKPDSQSKFKELDDNFEQLQQYYNDSFRSNTSSSF